MPLKIRLARGGAKKRPHYHVIVADSRAPRDGRFIDRIGSYDPMLSKENAKRFVIDVEKAKAWLFKGAQPTDRVQRFLSAVGLLEPLKRNNPQKAAPKKRAQERAEAQKSAEAAAKVAAETAAAEALAAKAAALAAPEPAPAEPALAEPEPVAEAPAEPPTPEPALAEPAPAEPGAEAPSPATEETPQS